MGAATRIFEMTRLWHGDANDRGGRGESQCPPANLLRRQPEKWVSFQSALTQRALPEDEGWINATLKRYGKL
jgi:hypothetical protein